jgi:hypothetical protein
LEATLLEATLLEATLAEATVGGVVAQVRGVPQGARPWRLIRPSMKR